MADDAPAALRLAAYLPYRLSIASNKASGVIARAYQTRFALSIPEWRIIAVLGETQPLTAQDLCEATAMDKVSVSRALRTLDLRGLVRRARRTHDRRASDVSLTAEGRSIYDEVAPLAIAYERALLAGLSADERKTLTALLVRLETRADALAEGSGGFADRD